MQKNLLTIILFSFFLLLLCTKCSFSDTIRVPDDFSRITDALLVCAEGDTLLVKAGKYSPLTTGDEFPLIVPDGIILQGEDRDHCVLDAGGSGCVMVISNLSSPNTLVKNFTITGGSSEQNGGGISIVNHSKVTVRNCHIIGNTTQNNGGGISISESVDAVIENCLIDSNTSVKRGGGIYCFNASPKLNNNSITYNSAYNGGGVSCINGSSPTLTRNTIEHNTAENQGGGVECYNQSSPFIHECIFRNNKSNKGAGLSVQSHSNPVITDNQFFKNMSVTGGGAVFLSSTGELIFKRNLVDGNEAGRNGGGIFMTEGCTALIDSNIVVGNKAGGSDGSYGYGGGITCYDGPSPSITNNVIQNNTSTLEGGGIHMHFRCSGLLENNDIQFNSAGYTRDGETGCGGGVFLNQANPVVRGNLISNNVSERGAGGIFIQNEYPQENPEDLHPLITNNTITYNVAYLDGGGIATSHCDSSIIIGNTISNNRAAHGGGAIHVRYDSKTYIADNYISDNRSEGSGGGAIFISDRSKPLIHNNTITANSTADKPGGAIDCLSGTAPVISENLISNNSGSPGGAINIRSQATVRINRNSILGNTSASSGGAVFSNGSGAIVALCNNTFYENQSSNGGTIETGEQVWTGVVNNIITNDSSTEPLIVHDSERAVVRNNCFWNTSGYTVGSAFDDTLNNFFANPRFADEPYHDFHILVESPCVDAGDPALPLDPDSTTADVGRYYFDQGKVVIEPPEVPVGEFPHVQLGQNYPNPFNPTTTINIIAGHDFSTPVEVSIFNSRGQLINRLLRNPLVAGVHSIIWNGRDMKGATVTSGVYFCRIITDDGESTIKMILSK